MFEALADLPDDVESAWSSVKLFYKFEGGHPERER